MLYITFFMGENSMIVWLVLCIYMFNYYNKSCYSTKLSIKLSDWFVKLYIIFKAKYITSSLLLLSIIRFNILFIKICLSYIFKNVLIIVFIIFYFLKIY